MSVEFLSQVAATPLPKSFNAEQDVDAIKVLLQAGLILAMVDGPPECRARVLAITDKGHAELMRLHHLQGSRASRTAGFSLPRVAQRARDV